MEYKEDKFLTLVPYVLHLLEIREGNKEKKDNYISKVLLFSNSSEKKMFYLSDNEPKELFSRNIMLVYTNPDVINEKYCGVTTILCTTQISFFN